jgi:hypothetical protein
MSRPKAPCGTDAAYRRHLKHEEPVDEACRDAHTAAGRESRKTVTPLTVLAKSASETADEGVEDDMKLIVDTLRTAFKAVAEEDPTKLAPIAREFRAAVEYVRGPVEPVKELSLAEQLAAAKSARAARTSGSSSSA